MAHTVKIKTPQPVPKFSVPAMVFFSKSSADGDLAELAKAFHPAILALQELPDNQLRRAAIEALLITKARVLEAAVDYAHRARLDERQR